MSVGVKELMAQMMLLLFPREMSSGESVQEGKMSVFYCRMVQEICGR